MEPLDRIIAERACEALIIDYAALNDAGAWDALADMYVKEGRMSRPSAPDTFIAGQDAIRAAFRSRPKRDSRHICANIRVTLDGPDGAFATSQILLFTATVAPPLVGSYRDILRLTENGWRFVQRRGSLDFAPK